MANVNRSARHAESIMDRGHTTSTRLMTPCDKRKSEAHIALAVLPVPCSLKQKAFRCFVKNSAVVFWCSKGLYVPGHWYCPLIGDGTSMFRLFNVRVSSTPHFTSTSLAPTALLLGTTLVTLFGCLRFSSSALLLTTCIVVLLGVHGLDLFGLSFCALAFCALA